MNLMKNAIQALDRSSGFLRLSTRHDSENGAVVLACRDNGPGIPEPLRTDVFKPFFTTKPVGQGTGLGLYICHQIAVRHGGSMSLENPAGGGVRVVLRIPDGRDTIPA
jgi:C4-dicarboxylate-specific signal transduction histidine kinase